MRWIIFAGRFQPFHLGHFEVVERTINSLCTPATILTLAAVTQETFESSTGDVAFTHVADEHHLPERNPWSLSTRLWALGGVTNYFRERHPELQINTTLLPRPDYGLRVIRSWFPGERSWIVPEAGEMFDEAKVKFFVDSGEKVVRVPDTSNVSGRILRESWKIGDVEEMRRQLPECVHRAYLDQAS